MFGMGQYCSLLSFFFCPLPPCKNCYSADPPVVPHVIHSLKRGQIPVPYVLLPRPGRERDKKKKQREPSYLRGSNGYLRLPVSFCLFLSLLLRWEFCLPGFPFPQRWGSTCWMQKVLKWDHSLWIYLEIKLGLSLSWLQNKAKIWSWWFEPMCCRKQDLLCSGFLLSALYSNSVCSKGARLWHWGVQYMSVFQTKRKGGTSAW